MAMKFGDGETAKLAAEIAKLTGESEQEAVRQALHERRSRLEARASSKVRPRKDLQRWLETEIWPQIPAELLDREPMTKAEVEELLGFGPRGC
jgi:hypothetical protein